ncbi:MAG TPA: hypothetical protein PLE30_02035 [Candidatus Kapabacteria bacterium]|nr:hypothetical protein [Candidatus Kapabacteria bacterium]
MKHMYIIACILLIFPITALSQGLYPKQQAGLGFSSISGGVISYQVEIDPTNAFKFGTFVYYNSNNPPDDLILYGNIGGEYQYNLIKEANQRLYALCGAAFWYLQDKNTHFKTENDIKYKIVQNNIKTLLNIGLGIGYEYKIHKQVALNIDIGVFGQTSFQDLGDFIWFVDRVGANKFTPSLSVGFGIRYAFY